MPRLLPAVCVISALVVAPGCKKKKADVAADPQVRGSGVGSFESRTLPAFTRVKVGGNLDVTIDVGKAAPLELQGDDNLIKLVPSNVENGELALTPDVALKKTQPLRLKLGVERLEALRAAVASRVTVHGVKADSLEVSTGGAARVTLDGSAAKLVVSARSISQVDLRELSAAEVTATADDMSRIAVGYAEKLDATQRSNAVISYRGTPDVAVHAERASSVGPAR